VISSIRKSIQPLLYGPSVERLAQHRRFRMGNTPSHQNSEMLLNVGFALQTVVSKFPETGEGESEKKTANGARNSNESALFPFRRPWEQRRLDNNTIANLTFPHAEEQTHLRGLR
jgi:hypothetical protein